MKTTSSFWRVGPKWPPANDIATSNTANTAPAAVQG